MLPATQPAIWALKSAGELKVRPGRNEVSKWSWKRSTMPLASGSAGLQMITFAPSTPRKAWVAAVSSGARARHRPTAPSPSHTSVLGTAPRVSRFAHHPANRSCSPREGTSTAARNREYPLTIVSTGSRVAVRTCPHPTGRVMSGNQKSNCASSPGR